jgi:hypothetical protein
MWGLKTSKAKGSLERTGDEIITKEDAIRIWHFGFKCIK